jgi:DNA-binding NarL/FixJ family response regulator
MKSLDLRPDVFILDSLFFSSEELLQVVHELKKKSPRTKILLLVVETEVSDKSLMQYMAGGVDGYIKGAANLKHLVEAIRTVHAGNVWADRKLLDKFVRCAPSITSDLESKLCGLENPLTKREREIISFLFLGLPNKDISHKMHISEKTVKTHLNNIFKKMQVRNRTQVVSTLLHSH